MKEQTQAILRCGLLFLNGIFALALEIIWCKRLEQLSGVGLFAVTETVSCFLLGLALGGWLGSKLCNSDEFWRTPRKYLVQLQSGTIIACLLFSILIFSSPLDWLAGSLISQLTCALLVVPALGMGMLLATAVICFSSSAHEQLKTRDFVPALYTCNLFGSYAGAGLAIFCFMPAAGLWHSALIAITISLIALCVLFRIPFESGKTAHSSDVLKAISPTAFLAVKHGILLVGISGFVSIALEIIYVRIAGLLFGAGIYAFGLVLIFYLLSSAVGAWAAISWRLELRSNSFVLFFAPLLAAAYLYVDLHILNQSPWAYLSIYNWLHEVAFNNFVAHLKACSLLLLALVFIPVASLGAFFVTVLASVRSENKAGSIGYLICANNIGSIIGAWAIGFVLIPFLSIYAISGMQQSIVVLIYILLALSLIAIDDINKTTPSLDISKAIKTQRVLAIFIVMQLLGLTYFATPKWNAVGLSLNVPRLCQNSQLPISRHNIELASHLNQLDYYHEGLNSTVAVFSNAQNNIQYLKIDGRNEGSGPIDWSRPPAVPCDLFTHLLLAELPMECAPARPLNVCLVGYGTGATANAVLLKSNLEELKILELEQSVLTTARFFKYPTMRFAAPRVAVHIRDARSYLLRSSTINDVIICQSSEPWTGGSSNLFSKQYWQICRKHLAKDGVICQWVQLYGLSPQLLADICRTFTSVFPDTAVIHEPGAGEILLLASVSPQNDIAAVFLQHKGKWEFKQLHPELMLTAAQLQQWCRQAALETHDNRIITDNNLLIEYAMPHVEQDSEACISQNLHSLMHYHENRNI